jgi:hypothetical protein
MHAELGRPLQLALPSSEAAEIAISRGRGAAFHTPMASAVHDAWYFQWRFAQSLHRDA